MTPNAAGTRISGHSQVIAGRWSGAGQLWPAEAPLLAQGVVAALIWALLDYTYHRASHTFSPLWWFHALHHDTPQLHLLKSGRLHFGEEMLRYLMFPAITQTSVNGCTMVGISLK